MYPDLLSLFDGKFVVHTYSVCIAVGLLVAMLLLRIFSKKLGLNDKAYDFYSLISLITVIVGFIFAFIFQDIYLFLDKGYSNIVNAFRTWFGGGKFELSGGITFMGGLIGGAAFFIVATLLCKDKDVKKQFPLVTDIVAPCILVAHGFGRIGCFFGGCCYGKETTSAFGMNYPVGDGVWAKVYPTQLYEAAFCFITFAVLAIILFKMKKRGFLIGIYAGAYSIFRFFVEFLRGDYRGGANIGISPSQVQSIVLLVVAIAYIGIKIYLDKRNDKKQNQCETTQNQ